MERILKQRDRLLGIATAMEGHPDNVAPALFGGLTIAWTGDGGQGGEEEQGIGKGAVYACWTCGGEAASWGGELF